MAFQELLWEERERGQVRLRTRQADLPIRGALCACLTVLVFGVQAIFPLAGGAIQAPGMSIGVPAGKGDQALYPSSERQPAEEDQPSEIIRQATAYNVGDPDQTDGNPCLTADGTNACKELAQGRKICAANFVPMGTRLMVEGFGICTVKDRMHPRYPDRIDIAMQPHEKKRAIRFGVRRLKVSVMK